MKKKITGLDVNLAVSFLQQGDYIVAYTPALDISTYGKTINEAKQNFDELISVFFEEFQDEASLANVLESLGWTKNKAEWAPPLEVKHTQTTVKVPSFS